MTRARLLSFGLLAVLLVPLIVGKTSLYPFVLYRTYFFYILVDVLFIVFLFHYGLRWVAPLVKNMVGRAAAIFIGAKFVTDILGLYPWVSFWGNYERMMGFTTHLHLFLFFAMAVTVFRERNHYLKLIDAFVCVSGLTALYGIVRPDITHERVFSTIGNPAFLAGFLLFGIFFGAWRVYEEHAQLRRILLGCSSFLSCIALYLTATRGALVGLAVGVFIGVTWLAWSKKNIRTPALITLFFIIISVFGLRTMKDFSFVQNQTTLRRLAAISFQDFTVQSRISAWGMAWDGIRERSLRGVGEVNIVHPLDRHMRQELLETWLDSSHNAFLDLLLAHGVIGFAAYLFLFFSVFHILWKKRNEAPIAVIGMTAALIAYLVQSVFIFDTLVVLLPIWLSFGFVVVLDSITIAQTSKRRDMPFVWTITACIGILLISYLRPIRALAAVGDGRYVEGLDLATFGYGNIASIIRDDALNNPQMFEIFRPVLDRAYAMARENEGELSPYYGDLAQVYLATPKFRTREAPAAESLLNRAILISPGRVDLYFAKGQALYESGNIEGAVALLREIQTRFPAHVARAGGVLDQLERVIDAR